MPAITANILIGRSSTKDGVYATHSMYLIEEEKPVWFLQETGIEETGLNGSCVTWVPRRESILENGLLMIALYVVKSKEIVELADKYLHSVGGDKADLNTDIVKNNLEELRKICRRQKMGRKLVITVMEGSALSSELHLLENYSVPVEVCTPQYSRRPKDQGYDYTVAGSLQQAENPIQIRH
ncbi:MAG: hypothetical protein SCK29_05445 [Bacillota bacterium]|nr:hypothetical protein [Bacillota bacterium]MDW7683548.1 hypothetical protein [Bacillota bacterium]